MVSALAVFFLGTHKIIRELLSIVSLALLTGLLLMRIVSPVSDDFTWQYMPGFFTLSFSLSSFGLLFALIAAISGLLKSFASWGINSKGYHALFHLMMGGLMILLSAGDYISFFLGWEIMTWSSFMLFNNFSSADDPIEKSQDTGFLFITLSLISALLMLGVLFFLYNRTGSMNIADGVAWLHGVKGLPSWIPGLLLMSAFFLKSGLLPFHVWVPGTYREAPHTFTAFLSAALSKVGIYAFILFFLPFSLNEGSGQISYLIAWIGAITATVATFKAIEQNDMKGLLAYSSIGQMAYVFTAMAVGSSLAMGGALFQMVNHSLIKLLLFFIVAGIIERTGKTRFDQLGGLIYKMPFSFIGVLVGIIALAGMPPLSGFYGKWMIYTSLIEKGWLLVLTGIVLPSTAAFIYCYKLIYGIFLGHPTEVNPEEAKEISPRYRVPSGLLMASIVLLGLFPGLILKPVNVLLSDLGMETLALTSQGSLNAASGSVSGFMVMNVFGGVFAVILILLSLFGKKAPTRNLHRLDIAYAGELPTEQTPLHYGRGLGHEVKRVAIAGAIVKRSLTEKYMKIGNQLGGILEHVRGFYPGNGQVSLIMTMVGAAAVALLIGLKG